MRVIRTRWAAVLLLVGIAAIVGYVYVSVLRASHIGAYHDEGLYLVTARALAEGRGYVISSLPDALPQTKYPPLFPLMLAAVWTLWPQFPADSPLLKAVPLLGLLCWVWVSIQFWRQVGGMPRRTAVFVGLLMAGSLHVVFLSTQLLSETTFAAFVTLSLLLLYRASESGRLPTVVWAALAAVLACYARSAGLAIIGGGTLALLQAKRYRLAGVFAAISGVLYVPWRIWQGQTSGRLPLVESYYTAQNYREWFVFSGYYAPAEVLHVLVRNIPAALIEPARPAHLDGRSGVGLVLIAVASAWLWFWAVRGLYRSGRALWGTALVGAAYVGMVLLWAWHPQRFLVPIYPVFILFVYRGMSKSRYAQAALAVFVALLLFASWRTVQTTEQFGVVMRPAPLGAAQPVHALDWNQFAALTEWVAHNTPSDAVVLANLDPFVYLYTERHAIRPYSLDPMAVFYGKRRSSADVKLAELRDVARRSRAGYLLATAVDPEDEPDWDGMLGQLVAAHEWEVAYEAAPGYLVYRRAGGVW